jgi:hypothetical protein
MKTKFTIETNTKSGSFSARSTYIPEGEKVIVRDWVFDSYGIIPGGVEVRELTVDSAREEYRQRRGAQWEVTTQHV